MKKYKFGIYGSGIAESEQAIQLAQELGYALAQQDIIIVTGGCSGMPYIVAQASKQCGAEIWGFTPERNEQEQQQAYPLDNIAIYDRLFFVPPQYAQHFFLTQPLSPPQDQRTRRKYRNVLSTTHVDAGLIVSGGWGTMNELTNLFYDEKPVGVLLGTGGLADAFQEWYPRLRKKSKSAVFFCNKPKDLVDNLLQKCSSLSCMRQDDSIM